jgi:FkbM family methyltransferase
MGLLKKTVEALRDGSFAIKVLNRFSRVKYEPMTGKSTDEIIAKTYPGDGWRNLSKEARSVWVRFSPVFNGMALKNVVWVGAHKGEAALAYDEAFPGLNIHLLEPVPASFGEVQRRIAGRPNFQAHNVAAGERDGEMDMNVDEYSASSSLLKYDPKALEDYPYLGKTRTTKVKIRPLDALLKEWGIDTVDFLVVDTQGYEAHVFAGAPEALRKCRIVLVEMNVHDVYQGGASFDTVYQTLRQNGLMLKFITHVHRGETGAVYQIDGVFMREPAGKTAGN